MALRDAVRHCYIQMTMHRLTQLMLRDIVDSGTSSSFNLEARITPSTERR
jgi:hypothetical protein